MGWNDFEVTTDIASDLKKMLSEMYEGKVVDIEVVDGDDEIAAVAYAAFETAEPEGQIIRGIVCLLEFGPEFGPNQYMLKEMFEEEGPVASGCPERILNLLSPTDNEDALDWRRRCRETLAEPWEGNKPN